MAACETHGHLWGRLGKCMFCWTPKPATVEEVELRSEVNEWLKSSKEDAIRSVTSAEMEISQLRSRVAVLEGLLRRWVATGAPVGTFGDVVFADTVTILAPAPLTEGK